MRRLLFRPLWLAAVTAAMILIAAVGLLGGVARQTLSHLREIERHAKRAESLQETGLNLQQALLSELNGDGETNGLMSHLRLEISVLEGLDFRRATDTPARLKEVRRLLVEAERQPRQALAAALDVYREILTAETVAQRQLRAEIHTDALLELGLAAGGLAALVALVLLGLLLFHHRLFDPLSDLGRLLSSLAAGERREIDAARSGTLLRPLFERYNGLVRRLAELEEASRARTRTLENEVEAATRELLRQRQSLVRAELMAAVGETAASLAHELRNPLAGIAMSLSNLSREIDDADHRERLRLASDELKRTSRIVDRLLDGARHTPEIPRPIRLASVVRELAGLLRHQLPDNVELAVTIADDLCRPLPEDGFRQALLNLILNSAQALDGRCGSIEVTVRAAGRDLEVTVDDDGPGFSPEFLESGIRLFASEHPGGIGLGLAMVRRFATDLGGDVLLDNREPHGARVTLHLPVGGEDG